MAAKMTAKMGFILKKIYIHVECVVYIIMLIMFSGVDWAFLKLRNIKYMKGVIPRQILNA